MTQFRLFILVVALLRLAAPADAQITVPNIFVPQTRIFSADVNDNFTELGDKALNRLNGTMLGQLIAQDLFPDGNNTRSLGSPSARWATVNGVLGNFSGAMTAASFVGSGATLTAIPETAIADGALLARVGSTETITGAWSLTNSAGIQFTAIGAAAAGKIGFSGNALTLIAGANGVDFLNSAGGPVGNLSATGRLQVTADSAANGLVVYGRAADSIGQLTFLNSVGSVSHGIVQVDPPSNAMRFFVGSGPTQTLSMTPVDITPLVRINSGPVQPGFLAYRTTDVNNSIGTIVMDGENYDNTNSHDTGTGIFTVPVTGQYLITGQASFTAGASACNASLSVVVNNGPGQVSYALDLTAADVGQPVGVSGSLILNVMSGDTVRLNAGCGFDNVLIGTTVTGLPSTTRNTFWSARLMP